MYYSLSLLSNNKEENENYFKNDQIRVNVKNTTTGNYLLGTATTGVLLSEVNGFDEGKSIGEGKMTLNSTIEGDTEYLYELRLWIDENVDYRSDMDENGISTGNTMIIYIQ